MVDVSNKPEVFREATAKGKILLKPETITIIKKQNRQRPLTPQKSQQF
jgi:molybdenum cofactor biosynthesis enzyme